MNIIQIILLIIAILNVVTSIAQKNILAMVGWIVVITQTSIILIQDHINGDGE